MNITPWQQSLWNPQPVTVKEKQEGVLGCVGSIKRGRINVCVLDLLYSERGADFLSSEDYGALSQDFRQLEGVQAQQLTGISDH